LNRPDELDEEVSVRPGLHRAESGRHSVVWFDPAVLTLRAPTAEGIENEQVLQGTPDQAEEGVRRYRDWTDRRTRRNQKGAVPGFRIVHPESSGHVEEAEGITVETLTLPAAEARPSGRKFGRLMHDILQRSKSPQDVPALASVWGRRHGASEEDRGAAISAATSALQCLARLVPAGAAQLRELPVLVRLQDGTIVDGRVDLAWTDGTQWTVVDYKTDRRDHRALGQLQLYALALRKATGLPVRAILLEI
jgi:ATP-dependent exoDNAse (exonuclease V) beta subunit